METKKKDKRVLINVLNIFFSILAIVVFMLYTRVEFLHMKELGLEYEKIYNINLKEKIYIMSITFVITFIYILCVNLFLKKDFKKLFKQENKEMPKINLFTPALLIGVLNSIVANFVFRGKILNLLHTAKFGKTVGILGLDYSFSLLISPIIQLLLFYITVFVILTIGYAFIYYILVVNFKLDGIDNNDFIKGNFVKLFRRLGIFLAYLTLIIYVLRTFDIYSGDMLKKQQPDNTYLTGAGLGDVTIKLWGRVILIFYFLITIIRLNKDIKKQEGIKVVKKVISIPVLLLSLQVILLLFNNVIIRQNRLEKENKFIEKNIKATEEAFNIKLDTKVISEAQELVKKDIIEAQEVIETVPIISKNIAKQNLESFKKKDSPYKYMNTSVINTEEGTKYFTSREINDTKKRTIEDKTYVFNHGIFGALTDSAHVDEDGFILFDEKMNNDKFTLGNKVIKQPRIYYGLNTNKTTVVGKDILEYDYEITSKETKEKEIFTNKYDGKSGLKLGKFDAFLLSLTKLDFNIFNEGQNKDNKVLFNREIIKRVKTVIPDITYDDKPYIVPNEKGGLTWVIDGYTWTSYYPYSQRIQIRDENGNLRRINYLKNSIKVLVDAYDGTVQFYILDETDPFAKQIQNKYPNIFKTEKDMPNIIKENLLYPRKLYDVQARIVENYHKIGADTLYRSEDIWEISSVKNENNKIIDTRYLNIKLENEEKPKLSLLTMYTPFSKQNINGYLIGSIVNGKNKLTLYKFDQNESLLSLNLMRDKIHEDEKAKIELDKISRMGTEVVRDTMLVPISTSILYVEPVYQIHLNENSVPVLKMVIVANGSKVGIGSSLKDAVSNLFSDTAININIYDPNDMNFLLEKIINGNKNLKESLNSKNWKYIGKDVDKLTKLIDELEKAKAKDDMRKNRENIDKIQSNRENENHELKVKKEKENTINSIFDRIFKPEDSNARK